jgi:hypothetical protein
MSRLDRAHDWPEQLIAFVEVRRRMPFAWGSNDCALFAADYVLRITGVDLAATWRGYDSAEGAAAHIAKVGGMPAFVASLTPREPNLAQRGDIVLADIEGRETFGLAVGSGLWAAPGEAGVVFRPMSDVLKAFEY